MKDPATWVKCSHHALLPLRGGGESEGFAPAAAPPGCCRLVGWLGGWLAGWLAGMMAGWLDGWLAGLLARGGERLRPQAHMRVANVHPDCRSGMAECSSPDGGKNIYRGLVTQEQICNSLTCRPTRVVARSARIAGCKICNLAFNNLVAHKGPADQISMKSDTYMSG